ncbi:MAG: Fe-only nitrogenase accessory AnfO family protein, partial [Clostridiaceae bacterium]
ILESNEKVTSKQILLPFFNNISFNELEIICGHIPPWFDKELKNLNLKFSTESISKDKFKVRIYRTNQE